MQKLKTITTDLEQMLVSHQDKNDRLAHYVVLRTTLTSFLNPGWAPSSGRSVAELPAQESHPSSVFNLKMK